MYWDVNYSNCAGGSSSSRVEEGKCCQLQMPQLTIWAWFAKLVCQTELPLFASACLHGFAFALMNRGWQVVCVALILSSIFWTWPDDPVRAWLCMVYTYRSMPFLFHCFPLPLFQSSLPKFAKSQAGLVYNPRCFVRGHWPFSLSTETQYYLHCLNVCSVHYPKVLSALRLYLRICWWACAVSPDALAG